MKKLSKNEWVAVSVGIVFVAYMLFGPQIKNAFFDNTLATKSTDQASLSFAEGEIKDVLVRDEVLGTGALVEKGKVLSVNYVLSLADGTVIQNSKDLGTPFSFVLGAGQVIPGWEMGFEGMKIGGVRTIIIPSTLGYGSQAVGPIPPNSTLVFTVELLSISDLPTSN